MVRAPEPSPSTPKQGSLGAQPALVGPLQTSTSATGKGGEYAPLVSRRTTDVERFVAAYERAHPLAPGAKRAAQWAFAHPGTVRAIQGTLATLSTAAYALGTVPATPWGWLVNAFGIATGGARAMQSKSGLQTACVMGGLLPIAVNSALGGPIAGIATGVGSALGAVLLGSSLFEKLMATPGYDTASYPYVDGTYAGGRLYHLPDARGGRAIPVLRLDAKRPLTAGFAHGYLLGPQIRLVMDNFRHELSQMPDFAKQFPHTLARFRDALAVDEEAELEGLVLGFNDRAREDGHPHRITFEELLAMQLLPDMMHFQWEQAEAKATGKPRAPATAKPPTVGCTSVMLRGADGQVTWGRNMDWSPFGMGGAVSLPIVWTNQPSGQDYAVLGIPGLIGVVTGWNAGGLSLAMNVVGGYTRRVAGVPAIFYNRRLLREAANVADVARLVADTTQQPPLGPYHLIVADATQGRCISFYQKADKSHHHRVLGEKPLWCLNWSYPGKGWDVFSSDDRHADLKSYFEASSALGPTSGQDQATLVEGSLRLGTTNNMVTLHTLVFNGDNVSMRWSNAFAAAQTAVEMRRDAVFQVRRAA